MILTTKLIKIVRLAARYKGLFTYEEEETQINNKKTRWTKMRKLDGKKFMWDNVHYLTEAEAKERITAYEKDGFETRLVKEDGKLLVYTRRIVTEIVLEEGGQP